MRRVSFSALAASAALSLGACQGAPAAPAEPTWADVEPILRGECVHCHGPTAAETGAVGPAAYRFDFFDSNDGDCGDAASAVETPIQARALAKLIASDVTAPAGGGRSRMPPAPAEPLADWQRETLIRWAARPNKGRAPFDNAVPRLRALSVPPQVTNTLVFSVVLNDPDSDPVLGVIRVGDQIVRLPRPGAFTVTIDASALSNGPTRITATLCDGWLNQPFDLGYVLVAH